MLIANYVAIKYSMFLVSDICGILTINILLLIITRLFYPLCIFMFFRVSICWTENEY